MESYRAGIIETIFITAKERTNFKNWVVILRFLQQKNGL